MKKLLLMLACLSLAIGLPACNKKDSYSKENRQKTGKQKKQTKMKKEKRSYSKKNGQGSTTTETTTRSMKY